MSKTTTGAPGLGAETEGRVTEAGTIAGLAVKAFGAVETHDAQGRTFVAVPDGRTLHEVTDPYGLPLAPPHFINQAVELFDKDSLTAYVKRHQTDTTIIFADPFKDVFSAQLDWHGKDVAGFNGHRATLTLQRSEEWTRWTAQSGKLMSQADFARFLEENAAEVEEPAGADLLEIARDLSAKRKVHWKSAVRLQNGDTGFEYAEETEASAKSAHGEVAVPNKFILRIPVYLGEPPVQIGAFLRYRIDPGGLALGYELHRPVFVQQAVFKQIGLDIAERTDCPVITGKPGQGVTHKPLTA